MKEHGRPKQTGRKKRLIGWLLSAFWVLGFYSPQAEALRQLPERLVIASGQETAAELPFPLRLTAEEPDVQALSATGDTLADVSEAKATVSLLGLIPLRQVTVEIRDDLRLYPGGQAVGVALQTEGVLVVGTSDLTGAFSPARLTGLKAGDVITQVNGKPLHSIEELTALVNEGGSRAMPLTVRRGEGELRLTLEPRQDGATGSYRIGAWVRDSTAGVGTLSFYGQMEEGGFLRYGALGHAITDADTQQVLTLSRGELMEADVVDVRKGQSGVPGELKGSFLREHRVLGNIRLNNQFGIYGQQCARPPALSGRPSHRPQGRCPHRPCVHPLHRQRHLYEGIRH